MSDQFQSNVDDILAANRAYAERFPDGDLDVEPQRNLAVVACMDTRLDLYQILGLANGDAHIIRNAGGAITDDAIRSLALSQRALNTKEIVLVHHTNCGAGKITEDGFRADLLADVGVTPTWAAESFADPYDDVRQSIRRLELSPFVNSDYVSGFVYDVETGLLKSVE